MKFFKYFLILLGIVTVIFSFINSYYENSIRANLWSFAMGSLIIWFALDKKLQKNSMTYNNRTK
jgi:hypothetical protein